MGKLLNTVLFHRGHRQRRRGQLLPLLAFGGATAWPTAPIEANDAFADRAILHGTAPWSIKDISEATREPGEPAHGRGATEDGSLWWSWTAPYTGDAVFSTYGSGSRMDLAVYTGPDLPSLRALGNNLPLGGVLSVTVGVEAGVEYHIAVQKNPFSLPVASRGAGSDGEVILTINAPPVPLLPAVLYLPAGRPVDQPIEAAGGAFAWAAEGLPPGVLIDPGGKLLGRPTASGSYPVTFRATNVAGTGSAQVSVVIGEGTRTAVKPYWRSGSSVAYGAVGYDFFEYQSVVGTDVVFEAQGLPAGLELVPREPGSDRNAPEAAVAIIRGTPTREGTSVATLTARSAEGSIAAEITIVIRPVPFPPLASSDAWAGGRTRERFTYTFSSREGGMNTSSRTDFFGDPAADRYRVGELPDGFFFNGLSNRIEGTPTVAGTYRIPVTAQNPGGSRDATLTIEFTDEEPAAPPGEGPPGPVVGEAGMRLILGDPVEGRTITAAGGGVVESFGAIGLPPGMAIERSNFTSGELTGAPAEAGVFHATVYAENAAGRTEATLTLVVEEAPPPTLASAASAEALVGVDFSFPLWATQLSGESNRDLARVDPPLTIDVSGLPPGLEYRVSGSTFWPSYAIAGVPTEAGVFEVPVVLSARGRSGIANLTIVVHAIPPRPPLVSVTGSAAAQVGSYDVWSIPVSGFPGSVRVDGLPPGLTFDAASQRVSGRPEAEGTFDLIVSAENARGGDEAVFTLEVEPPGRPSLSLPAGIRATVGEPFNQVVNIGSEPAGYAVALTAEGLPPGLALGEDRWIRGTPGAAGCFPVLLRAENVSGAAEAVVTIDVLPEDLRPWVSAIAMAQVQVGRFLSYPFDLANASGATVDGLPGWLTFDGDRRLSGTADAAGDHTVVITATGPEGEMSVSVLIRAVEEETPRPRITSDPGAAAYVGHPFTFQLRASPAPDSFALEGAPDWVDLDVATGVLTGVPPALGTHAFTVTASGPERTSAAATFAIYVEEVPAPTVFAALVEAIPMARSFNVGADVPIASSGVADLPEPNYFDEETGSIQFPGVFPRPFRATLSVDGPGGPASSTVHFTPNADLYDLPFAPAMVNVVVGEAFRYPISSSISSSSGVEIEAVNLPPGTAFDPATLEVHGTLTAPGVYPVNLSLRSEPLGVPDPVDLVLTLHVREHVPPPLITSAAVVEKALGERFTHRVRTLPTGLPGSFSAEGLPPGLTIDGDGRVQGAATAGGVFPAAVSFDAITGRRVATVTFAIDPAPPRPRVTRGASFAATVGQWTSYNPNAIGVITAFRAEGLPRGLSLSTIGNRIEGYPEEAGEFEVTLTFENGGGTTVVRPVFRVDLPPRPLVTNPAFGRVEEDRSAHREWIQFSPEPTRSEFLGLPHGLEVIDGALRYGTSSGIAPGTYPITVAAENEGGVIETVLTREITPVPRVRPEVPRAVAATLGRWFEHELRSYPSRGGRFVEAAGLPPGLVFYASEQVIRGVPSGLGEAELTLDFQDGGTTHTTGLTIRVDPPPAEPPRLISPPSFLARRGEPVSFALRASDPAAAISVAGLPPGLSFDPITGTIVGAPLASGRARFRVTLGNEAGTATANVAAEVVEPLWQVLTGPSQLVLPVGQEVSTRLGTVDSISRSKANELPVAFVARGLPAGLHLHREFGTLAGTVEEPGEYPVEVFTRGLRGVTSATLVLSVEGAGSALAQPDLSQIPLMALAWAGYPTSIEIDIPWAESVTVDGLPPGLHFDPASSEISGIPAAEGTYPLGVTAGNGAGARSATLTLHVEPSPGAPVLGARSFFVLRAGEPSSTYLRFEDLNPAARFVRRPDRVEITGLPPGLALDPAMERIVGTATTPGRYRAVVTATSGEATQPGFIVFRVDEAAEPRDGDLLSGGGGASAAAREAFEFRDLQAATRAFVGTAFDYRIYSRTAGAGTSITVENLPPGIGWEGGPGSGRLFGTPTTPGIFRVPIEASEGGQTQRADLTVYIAPADGDGDLPGIRFRAGLERIDPESAALPGEAQEEFTTLAGASVFLAAASDGRPPLSWEFTADGQPVGVADGPTAALGPVSLDQDGAILQARAVFAEGEVESTPVVLRVRPAGLTFAAWASATQLPVGLDRPVDDADADGVPNLLAYALGDSGEGFRDERGLPLAHTLEEGWMSLAYRRAKDRADLRFLPAASTDVATWSTDGLIHEMIADDGLVETWRAITFGGGDPTFIRLEIRLLPGAGN